MGQYGKDYKVEVLYKELILKFNFDIDLVPPEEEQVCKGKIFRWVMVVGIVSFSR